MDLWICPYCGESKVVLVTTCVLLNYKVAVLCAKCGKQYREVEIVLPEDNSATLYPDETTAPMYNIYSPPGSVS